jgi:hypothetical protein
MHAHGRTHTKARALTPSKRVCAAPKGRAPSSCALFICSMPCLQGEGGEGAAGTWGTLGAAQGSLAQRACRTHALGGAHARVSKRRCEPLRSCSPDEGSPAPVQRRPGVVARRAVDRHLVPKGDHQPLPHLGARDTRGARGLDARERGSQRLKAPGAPLQGPGQAGSRACRARGRRRRHAQGRVPPKKRKRAGRARRTSASSTRRAKPPLVRMTSRVKLPLGLSEASKGAGGCGQAGQGRAAAGFPGGSGSVREP